MAADDQPSSGLNHPPTGLDRLLSVVRWLIAHGKELAASIHQRAAEPDFPQFARRFGTLNVALILARITRGLRRAAALEAALLVRAAKGQEDAPVASVRLPSDTCPSRREPADPPRPRRDHDADDAALLARLPTEQEIADDVRRRPIGAVLVDICHDLGILPRQLPRAFYDELCRVIGRYGGSFLVMFNDARWRMDCWTRTGPLAHLFQPDPQPAASPCGGRGPPA